MQLHSLTPPNESMIKGVDNSTWLLTRLRLTQAVPLTARIVDTSGPSCGYSALAFAATVAFALATRRAISSAGMLSFRRSVRPIRNTTLVESEGIRTSLLFSLSAARFRLRITLRVVSPLSIFCSTRCPYTSGSRNFMYDVRSSELLEIFAFSNIGTFVLPFLL